jgi:quinol monooxygenase YgiN
MQPTIAVFGYLRFPPEQMPVVLPHLRTLVDSTYQNDGCIAYDVAEDPFDPGLIRFSELWPDDESLTRHLQAPHIEPWRAGAPGCLWSTGGACAGVRIFDCPWQVKSSLDRTKPKHLAKQSRRFYSGSNNGILRAGSAGSSRSVRLSQNTFHR